MTETPPFVRWTLALGCALREDTDWTNPEQTERQLRSLRGYSDAVHEGRIFEGICVAADATTSSEALGFPAKEVLNAYGGETFVNAQCPGCPANVIDGRERSALAGCFGLLAMDEATTSVWEAALLDINLPESLFLPTHPRWYGLWTASPFGKEQLQVLLKVLERSSLLSDACHHAFFHALERSLQSALPLYAQLFPSGRFDETTWCIDAHCGRCKARMTMQQYRCHVCDLQARAAEGRRRKQRGRRPYVPLARFLGERGAAEFLTRYSGQPTKQIERHFD